MLPLSLASSPSRASERARAPPLLRRSSPLHVESEPPSLPRYRDRSILSPFLSDIRRWTRWNPSSLFLPLLNLHALNPRGCRPMRSLSLPSPVPPLPCLSARSWGSEMLSSSDSCVCYVSVCRAVATSPTCVAFPCVNVGVCVSQSKLGA